MVTAAKTVCHTPAGAYTVLSQWPPQKLTCSDKCKVEEQVENVRDISAVKLCVTSGQLLYNLCPERAIWHLKFGEEADTVML